MKKTILLVLSALLLTANAPAAIKPEKVKPVKNIILLVTDGTSLSTVSLSRWMQFYNDPTKPNLLIDPYLCGTVRTNCSDSPIGDSAPTTSCYVTGHASRAGYVSTFPPDKGKDNIDPIDSTKSYGPMATLLEAAKQLQGKSTGLVVTCHFPHATPADCSAHYYNRGASDIIAEQQVHQNLDVVIGGGNYYLKDRHEEYLKKHGYEVIRDNVQALRSSKASKLWALFHSGDMDYDIDRDDTKQPSLAETTEIALKILSKNKKGFFLMVEGSQVDYAAHRNDPAALSPEFLAFDKACGVALDFARRDGNTAVIIVPDHGNSGMSIGCSRLSNYSRQPMDVVFGPIAKYKMSARRLTQKLNEEPFDSVRSFFKTYEGCDLTDEEVDQLAHCKSYEKSPLPKELRTRGDMEGFVISLLNTRNYLGWTTFGHTGEDVFLAAYHPKGTIPMGMSTNVELAHYMQACFGLYGKMDQFTDRIFTHHDIAFKGYDYEIVKPEEKGAFPKLVVKNLRNGKQLTIDAFTNIVTLTGSASRVVELPSVMTYVDRTDKFYVPRDLGNLLK